MSSAWQDSSFTDSYSAGKLVQPRTDAAYYQTRYTLPSDQVKPEPVLIDVEEPVRSAVRYPDHDAQGDVIEPVGGRLRYNDN